MNNTIQIYGARAHNLQNIDLCLPQESLIVITGLSGSGKSSLAFDTLYAEGQRRYMETFSAYARQFIGNLERPDVDKIDGLSPVIAIEQKTTHKNPRSTVGTITEIYDYLRLLYARIGEAYSYVTQEPMIKYTEEQILDQLSEKYQGQSIQILAPLVKGRKGHYREIFEYIRKQGYIRARVDGEIKEILPNMSLDRYKMHDIEVCIDKITPKESNLKRLSEAVQTALKQGKGQLMVYVESLDKIEHYSKMLMCPTSGIAYPEPEPNTFSFNSPYGACPHCNGLGVEFIVDLESIMPDPSLSISAGGIVFFNSTVNKDNKFGSEWMLNQIEIIGKKFGFTLKTPLEEISEEGMNAILYGYNDYFEIYNKNLGIHQKYNADFDGICNYLLEVYNDPLSNLQKWALNYMRKIKCRECNGDRLDKIPLHFKIDNRNISEVSNLSLSDLRTWILGLKDKIKPWQLKIAQEIIKEIDKRLQFLLDVGIGYLSLNREAGSLSGGESQRIRLATQIGTQLTGVLYILDEPSIGLHQRDNHRLIESLKKLRDLGNTVIVVEHDEDMMRAADYIVDIGPGAGVNGGKVCAAGTFEEFLKQKTLTTDYLNHYLKIEVPACKRKGNGKKIVLEGACGNNLKNVRLEIPLHQMVCVTGVSGSGKSSLITQTLQPILSNHFYHSKQQPLPYTRIEGLENIDKVIEVDQSPIGRTPRSNPATYVGVFDEIRRLYATLPDSQIRGYKAGRFSFNVKGGRCEKCGGAGVQTIEMNFLPDVYVNCEECNGKRYNPETLEIRYKGKSINDVLNMSIDTACEFFATIPSILYKLKSLQDVGLGYITLGQASTTLSGGEAQRIKLANELSKKSTGKTLYILDEPTTGLHFEDIRILLNVLQKLVDQGNTVLVIEHNLDIVKCADHIIELGLEGGKEGGEIIFQGSVDELIASGIGYTSHYLKKLLENQ